MKLKKLLFVALVSLLMFTLVGCKKSANVNDLFLEWKEDGKITEDSNIAGEEYRSVSVYFQENRSGSYSHDLVVYVFFTKLSDDKVETSYYGATLTLRFKVDTSSGKAVVSYEELPTFVFNLGVSSIISGNVDPRVVMNNEKKGFVDLTREITEKEVEMFRTAVQEAQNILYGAETSFSFRKLGFKVHK